MVDELKPVYKSRLIDRVRFGERYLRDCIDDIVNKGALTRLQSRKPEKRNGKPKGASPSPYDDLNVPKEKAHSLDESI